LSITPLIEESRDVPEHIHLGLVTCAPSRPGNGADMASIMPYDLVASTLRMPENEFQKWSAENSLVFARREKSSSLAAGGIENALSFGLRSG